VLRSRIIPCLLLRDGGLVKTKNFRSPKYIGDPINAVKIFNEKEVDELMFLDIDASAQRRVPDLQLLRHIASESRMPLCYGGGISNVELASKIVSLGFEKISVSAAALARPALIKEMADAIGGQSVVLTLDVKKSKFGGGYSVFTLNGTNKVKRNLIDICKEAEVNGVGEIVINSIDRDGEMIGYDLDLASMVRSNVSIPLSMLGGAGNIQHMQELIDTVGIVGAAAGSMFVFRGPYRAVLISYARPGNTR